MGEKRNDMLEVDYDRRIKLEFRGSKITSDAGLIVYRELDDALGLTDIASETIHDPRAGKNIRHSTPALLRQSIYSRLAGYEDVNDADHLANDPAMRCVVGGRAVDRGAASSSEMARFETDILSRKKNLVSLMKMPGRWIDRMNEIHPPKEIILDMDSSVSETHGHQQGSEYNSHFECDCYHPLFIFNQYGDVESAALRRGKTSSAKYWRQFMLPVIERCRRNDVPKYFRGDAAFAIPGLYRLLEAEEYEYVIRLKSNALLQKRIAHLLKRPVGRPSREPKVFYSSFQYQAKSWNISRRVVAKVQWHEGELYPRVGFIVTNMNNHPKTITKFYNGRGTAEQWIKEGKNAIKWTRLSCKYFRDNQVRLQLFILAYNLGNFLREVGLPRSIRHWSLTTLREKLIKTGAKMIRHARRLVFQMAQAAIEKPLFAAILHRVQRLRFAYG